MWKHTKKKPNENNKVSNVFNAWPTGAGNGLENPEILERRVYKTGNPLAAGIQSLRFDSSGFFDHEPA